MTPEQTILVGKQAEQLLRDPMLVQAFEDVRENIHAQIENSSFGEGEDREAAYHMLRALASLKGQIDKHVRLAAGAQAEANELDRSTVLRVAELTKE